MNFFKSFYAALWDITIQFCINLFYWFYIAILKRNYSDVWDTVINQLIQQKDFQKNLFVVFKFLFVSVYFLYN